MARFGIGIIGTDSLKTSTANQQIIPSPSDASWNIGYKLYKFQFVNDQDCNVIINGNTTLFLRGGYGFEIDNDDAPITSFVIVNSGITYTFTGFY